MLTALLICESERVVKINGKSTRTPTVEFSSVPVGRVAIRKLSCCPPLSLLTKMVLGFAVNADNKYTDPNPRSNGTALVNFDSSADLISLSF